MANALTRRLLVQSVLSNVVANSCWDSLVCHYEAIFLKLVIITVFIHLFVTCYCYCHVWTAVNPNELKQARHQQSSSFNVWVGILGDCLVGPHFLPRGLNGEQYLRFLRSDLPNLLEDVPMRQCQQMWFMHDGAPAHFHLSVRRYLNRRYGERWIGRGGPAQWPPWSPENAPFKHR